MHGTVACQMWWPLPTARLTRGEVGWQKQVWTYKEVWCLNDVVRIVYAFRYNLSQHLHQQALLVDLDWGPCSPLQVA